MCSLAIRPIIQTKDWASTIIVAILLAMIKFGALQLIPITYGNTAMSENAPVNCQHIVYFLNLIC